MAKGEIVRIEIDVPGEGVEAHEYEHCPLRSVHQDTCRVRTIRCRYGLTDPSPPVGCPIRRGTVVMKFCLYKEISFDEEV